MSTARLMFGWHRLLRIGGSILLSHSVLNEGLSELSVQIWKQLHGGVSCTEPFIVFLMKERCSDYRWQGNTLVTYECWPLERLENNSTML